MKRTIAFVLMISLCFVFTACGQSDADVWADALYTEDTELGDGSKTILVEVVAEDKSVTFTIHSDQNTLGDALVEHNLIDGEQGPYGLYVKNVNGILADYDKNQRYWGFNKNGEGLMSGVDGVIFEDGDHYEIIYSK